MGCINDRPLKSNKIRKLQFQNKYHHSANPIIQIAKQWNVDIIRERWHDNEVDVVRAKLGPKVDKITKDQFLKLIPGMSNFSQASQENFYELFNFEENPVLSMSNFVTSQIILLKSDDYDLLADMFFFTYSTAPNKTQMNTSDYTSFSRQFKQYQLQFMDQTVKPPKDQNGETVISKKLFRQIFQQYDMKTIKQLFKFNLKQQERKLQKHLATYGVDRVNDTQVFMVEFQWFLKWKNYMEHKYGIKVDLKENGKRLDKEKNNFLSTTFKTNEKWLKAGEKLAIESEDIYMEPVNNQRIKGEEINELKQNLLEFSDFISIPAQLWSQIRIIYGGGPAISKPFPHFYNKRITLVMLDQSKCEFIPGFCKALVYNPNETFEQIYKNRQQRYFMKESFQDMVVYYKHPGELEWKKITQLDKKLETLPFQYKSFVVYVRSEVAIKFEDKFNLSQVKGKKQMKQRVRNYGNLLNFQHQAILQQGYVGGIFTNTALLFLKSSKGQYMKIQSRLNDLEKLNPNVLQDNFMQGFAGLQNIGNTCYMNAPLQCLLKTPYFDEYMDSVNLDRGRKDMLTYQLQQIHDQSRNSRDCISMSNFKKHFDEKFPFFEGTAQHDAQQFLLLLLDKLSEQQPRQSLITPQQIKKNKKIHTFFSGLTRSQTQCVSCHNKGRSQQSFFTYSLSLPIIKQVMLKFFFVDEYFRVKRYGLTIERDCEVGEVVRMIKNELNLGQEVMIVSVCEGEWLNDVCKLNSTYKVSKLENYDCMIVCYPLEYKETPDYEDLIQGKTKNSIKLQVRNRVYDEKKKTYKPFHLPFCLQVNHQTTGKSLTYTIIDKIKKFINDQEYHQFKNFEEEFQDQYIKLLGTNSTNKEKPTEIQQQETNLVKKLQTKKNKTSREKLKDLPFTIQYLRKQDGVRSVCWFCKKNIDHSAKKINQRTDCQGCDFNDTERLYENRSFMKGFNSLLISIDWKNQLFSKDWTIEETRSYKQAIKQQNARKSHLIKLLKQAADQQQCIQLKCQKHQCRSKEALRKQSIIQAPNILILNLKRFYYQDNTFHKLKNKVVIPEEFELPGFSDKYELYGNVVHYGSGSGRGGHYVNYVKVNGRWYRCDDEKVHFTKDPDEHLNPDSYLLFYKRQKIDKSWTFFGF